MREDAYALDRQIASTLGDISGQSVTMNEMDVPETWALDVEPGCVLAGRQSCNLRMLHDTEEHVLTAMIVAKDVLQGWDWNTMTDEDCPATMGPASVFGWTNIVVQDPHPQIDYRLITVPLDVMAESYGELFETDLPDVAKVDPYSSEPWFNGATKLIRAAIRYARLIELQAPQIIIDNDVRSSNREFAALAGAPWDLPVLANLKATVKTIGIPIDGLS